MIKSWIDKDKKNTAELWQTLKTEYRIHAADKQFELLCKFTFILMNMYNNDIQTFISDFREICNKLKMIKYDLSDWQKNDRFINALKAHQQEFVRTKQDKHCDA